jgi:DNA ligase-1
MKFKELAVYLDRLEKTSSRIEITKILAELFKKSGKDEIDQVVYLSLGGLAPPYERVVFNIAERTMLAVIAQAYSKNREEVKRLYKKAGDLGDVAFVLAQAQISKLKAPSGPGKRQNLSVKEVYIKLKQIAQDEGEGSQERKVKSTAKLLGQLDTLSAKFVVRIPIGRLRLGFSDKTIIDALSWYRRGDKSAKTELERAFYVLPDVGLLAKKVKSLGVKKATRNPKPAVGVPVLPMLAQRLKSPKEMIEKMEEVAVESKFDGLRIQLHFKRKGFAKASSRGVKAYTRNMNETSWMFPELKNLKDNIRAREVILDSEAVGVDEKRRALANFQMTMTRRRKHDISETASKIPIKFYVFDLLLKNGKGLLDLPYKKRREELAKTVKSGNVVQLVDFKITKDPKEIEREMSKKLSEGMEGIIVKRTSSRYVPGRTGWRWVKMKEAEKSVTKLADTIDCIVMGYSVGRGRRAQFGVGQFLVGVLDPPAGGRIKTVTKIGTGITDEQFRELKKRLSKIETRLKPKEYEVDKNLEPDFWVRPALVVEIAADEITKSPRHSSGLALRFPRLVKFRDDKSINQATTLSEVKKLFRLQKN